jgi:hypothetical protein
LALAKLEDSQHNFKHAIGYAFLALDRPIPRTLLWRENDAYGAAPAALILELRNKLELRAS